MQCIQFGGVSMFKARRIYSYYFSPLFYLILSGQWLEVIVLAEVQHQGEQTEDLSVETELQEEPVVVFSHTVVDPCMEKGNEI